MKPFERLTKRIYNTEPLLARYDSVITKIGENYVELDATVAYPEGGGQEADHGVLEKEGISLPFVDVKKVYTNPVQLNNFPTIDSNGVIWHYVHDENKEKLKSFSLGDRVSIQIDIERRAKLSISHTASHILYMAINQCRAGVVDHVFGCHIKTDGARFDFYTDKFTEENIKHIESICNQIVNGKQLVETKLHEENNDAKYWSCQGFVIPCGGTHVNNTGVIQSMKIKRKGLGAGKERVMCTFESDVESQVRLMNAYTQQAQ
jgi:Ser-tRNA(Ala) deacylase AlaX